MDCIRVDFYCHNHSIPPIQTLGFRGVTDMFNKS